MITAGETSPSACRCCGNKDHDKASCPLILNKKRIWCKNHPGMDGSHTTAACMNPGPPGGPNPSPSSRGRGGRGKSRGRGNSHGRNGERWSHNSSNERTDEKVNTVVSEVNPPKKADEYTCMVTLEEVPITESALTQ